MQPAHVAAQVLAAFELRRVDDLRVHCRVMRGVGHSYLSLTGSVRGWASLGQRHWPGLDARLDLDDVVAWNENHAWVSSLADPRGTPPSAAGAAEYSGTLHLHARGVALETNGHAGWGDALAVPIYTRPDDATEWFVGPGDIRLDWLEVAIPYRARAQWFVTPDARQEVVSEFQMSDAAGDVSGQLTCTFPGHHGLPCTFPGHHGLPAFRTDARVSGTATPSTFGGEALQEWRRVQADVERNVVTTSIWGGLTRLTVQCDLTLALQFGRVEVLGT
jgi:hypothetical protein